MADLGINKSDNVKPFWVMFLKDPMNGVITGTAYGHNCKADYKTNPYFIGSQMIEVDMDWLKP